MTDEIGYCTVEDVRRVLQEAELDGARDEDANRAVADAIRSQTEWLQERTNRHWYVDERPDEDADHKLLATDAVEHTGDELDIAESAHSDHVQRFRGGRGRSARYPVRHAGPYTRVKLSRRDALEVTELLVRNQDGSVTDWVETRDEGRGDDYYLKTADGTGFSYLYLHTGTLPRLSDYGAAVVATYDYGIEGLPGTVRRAIAMRAAAQLHVDDEAGLAIPSEGQLMGAESKVQALERQAEELLEVHL